MVIPYYFVLLHAAPLRSRNHVTKCIYLRFCEIGHKTEAAGQSSQKQLLISDSVPDECCDLPPSLCLRFPVKSAQKDERP